MPIRRKAAIDRKPKQERDDRSAVDKILTPRTTKFKGSRAGMSRKQIDEKFYFEQMIKRCKKITDYFTIKLEEEQSSPLDYCGYSQETPLIWEEVDEYEYDIEESQSQ